MDAWLIVAVISAWVLIEAVAIRTDKRHIRAYLDRGGASNIKVDWDWGGGHRGVHAYHVTYSDKQATHRYTHCKVGMWGGEIYWMEYPPVV